MVVNGLLIVVLDVQGKISELKIEIKVLEKENENLRAKYLDALNAYKSAVREYDSVSAMYSDVYMEYKTYKQEAIAPPYIIISGRRAHIVWKSKGIREWTIPIDSYRERISKPKPKKYLILKDELGTVHRLIDFRPFVNTYFFSEVMPEVYKESGSDEEFIAEIWRMIKGLVIYTSEIKETPRWPIETLIEGGGDCEDVAILIASMIKAADAGYNVKLVYMNSKAPNRLAAPNHAVVYVEKEDFKAFIDGTSKVMNPFGDIKGWFFEI
jgi:hypothetical protein